LKNQKPLVCPVPFLRGEENQAVFGLWKKLSN